MGQKRLESLDVVAAQGFDSVWPLLRCVGERQGSFAQDCHVMGRANGRDTGLVVGC